MKAVVEFGWPSRARGNCGTENSQVEQHMKEKWGQYHKAYLRGWYITFKSHASAR